MYPLFFKYVFRNLDAEQAHHLGFGAIRAVGRVPGGRQAMAKVLAPRDPALAVRAFGIDFPGPFGLAAGFDKNAVGIDELGALGFDFVEIGTVTAQPQDGNPKKRLFRLVADRAVVNRMGFNNDGAAAVAARLHARGPRRPKRPTVLGVNIGKTKVVAEADAVADYVASTEKLARYADYLVVNVSSPNTPGLRNLQAVEVLRPLLAAVRDAADRTVTARRVPLLVKIAPDLADEDVDAVADLALELGLDGIIATNTTISREGLDSSAEEVEACGAGGLSGAPLKARSVEVLRRLRARVGDRLVLVGVGGVETADDVWERLEAGATLVQGYTAFIYEGPFWGRKIHKGLSARLRASGRLSIADVTATAPSTPA
ncbi:quinone-dependent dihydroorotate dehydrogenase [Yinghuangia seranimata]|uniref:quinone-dependent dihydroorotate dehydrogenase n=1 Tax=Yinghuangia seranimata TaxID=408067 RepID=UPI00248B12D7|nr:quinone-dependent dihydroorotate dehydrogenase [Yinghuangia seranimata]MDI2126430.1 quinone-dependent dihydroorotate dehydrogenase [Yinghuangia seranimata]